MRIHHRKDTQDARRDERPVCHDDAEGVGSRMIDEASNVVNHGQPKLSSGQLHRTRRCFTSPATSFVDSGEDSDDFESGRMECEQRTNRDLWCSRVHDAPRNARRHRGERAHDNRR